MADEASGVDVSWMHHTTKDIHQRTKPIPPSNIANDPAPPTSNGSSNRDKTSDITHPETPIHQFEAGGTPVREGKHSQDTSSPVANTGTVPKQHALKRPHLRSKNSNLATERVPGTSNSPSAVTGDQVPLSPRGSRRNSWISNLSSKFSSSPSSPQVNPGRDHPGNQKRPAPSPKTEPANPFNGVGQPHDIKENRPTDPAAQDRTKPSNASFFTNALRRLSSSGSGLGRLSGTGTTAQRRVMNLDPNRERCRVPDLEKAKLRRVAFCVDVEIAGYARYEDVEDDQEAAPSKSHSLATLEREASVKKKKDAKDSKVKDMGEGAALRNPDKTVAEKESTGVIEANEEDVGTSNQPKPEGELVKERDSGPTMSNESSNTKKKEKKKKSEAERKERKERKRRQAEANGTIPLELTREEDSDTSPGSTSPGATTPPSERPQIRPTTDPMRIYKRCAQLRETPALKKILDQISAPSSTLSEAPGTVAVLDLTGVWMKLADIVTLGDWLAIVPVRKLILENCGLSDDAVKVILSGLLSCKTLEQAKHNRKLAKKNNHNGAGQELLGVVEKVSLKDNPKITRIGWECIGLFIHMSKSLKAIDISGIPFPKPPKSSISRPSGQADDPSERLCTIISKGLAERLGGNRLEELIMSQCNLSAHHVSKIVDGAIACGLRRLGLAENNLSADVIEHIVRYLKSGVGEGLDLGGNHLHGHLEAFADALHPQNPLVTLSLASCSVETTDLAVMLPQLVKLPNFRFIDLSHNQAMFTSQPNALPLLRRYLPQARMLKRIHLLDVNLTPDDAIGLAEILPECESLAYVGLLENKQISALAGNKENVSQEEACAVYASLMTAVRCSQSIVSIDIEVPSSGSSEVVKAIASQIVAYSLRNLENLPLTEGEPSAIPAVPESMKHAPEVLLHLVGHMEGYEEDASDDAPAPDEDYYISATGLVKALGVCLGTAEHVSRVASRDVSPAASGTASPRRLSKPVVHRRPKDMSKELLESARKIRIRLQPALVKEDQLGNDYNYRRLQFLDSTLERIIERFEDEYPETRAEAKKDGDLNVDHTKLDQSDSQLLAECIKAQDRLGDVISNEDRVSVEDDEHPYAVRLSRRSSNTSLKTRALTSEEGRMHRFGQQFRREILKPEGLDYAHGTDETSVDPPHLALLRAKLGEMRSEDIRQRVIDLGYEKAIEEIGASAEELAQLEKEDPEGFQKLKEAQIAAAANS